VVDLAWKNLLHDKLRFAITVSGIAFAVTLILVQSGLFIGLLDAASTPIERAGADLWVTPKNTPTLEFPHGFPEERLNRVRSVPGVERADKLIVAFMDVALPTGAQESVVVYALEDFTRWNLPWSIVEGDVRDLRRTPSFMLDESADARFGAFQIGEYREIAGRRLKIVGRTRDAKSFATAPMAFMDYRLAQEVFEPARGKSCYLLVKLEPGADITAVQAEIARRVPWNDVWTRDAWAEQSRQYWYVNAGIGLNMAVTVFLGCLVGTVVVAQTLYTSTMEHIREFGTLKAIGGSNRDIYVIIGRQALIAALVGFVVGMIPSLALVPAVEALGLKLRLSGEMVVEVFVGTIVMCLVAAAVSFRKVASIDPALVFRG